MMNTSHVNSFLIFIVTIFVSINAAHAADRKFSRTIVYTSADWVPFCYINSEEKPAGLYIDLLKIIFEEEMGIGLNYQPLPWKRAQVNVENGAADVLLTVATQNRLEYTIKTESPVLQMYLYVYTYKQHPDIQEIDTISSGMDIKHLNLTPVTNIGNGWHKNNIDEYGVQTRYVPSEENAFKVLASRRADITIEPLYAGSYLINKLKLSDKIVQTSGRFGPLTFYILIGKKSVFAGEIEQINQAVNKFINSPRYLKLLEQYKKIY